MRLYRLQNKTFLAIVRNSIPVEKREENDTLSEIFERENIEWC